MSFLKRLFSIFFNSILGTITILLAIFSILGGIVSVVWLMILGQWGALGLGILFIVLSPYLLSFALMPSFFILAPTFALIDSGKKISGFLLGQLVNLWRIVVITIWCFSILFIFVKPETSATFLPRLFWSSAVAIVPWLFLSEKDGDNIYSTITMLFLQIAYLTLMVMVYFGTTFEIAIKTFIGIMILCQVITAILAFQIDKSRREF